jgi:hypothetical protein
VLLIIPAMICTDLSLTKLYTTVPKGQQDVAYLIFICGSESDPALAGISRSVSRRLGEGNTA